MDFHKSKSSIISLSNKLDLFIFFFYHGGWCTYPPTTPSSVNNPSGSLGPGKSQAQCALTGLQPTGCWVAVFSPSVLTSNALIQKTLRQTALIDRGDRHVIFKLAFCWYSVFLSP